MADQAKQLAKLWVLQNFILECEHARKDPVDCRLIMFDDPNYTNDELIHELLILSDQRHPVFTKEALLAMGEEIKAKIVALQDQA